MESRSRRGPVYNSLDVKELEELMTFFKTKRYLASSHGVDKTLKKPNTNGYAQFTVQKCLSSTVRRKLGAVEGKQKKLLIHPFVWRYHHGGEVIQTGNEIGHLHADKSVLLLVQESAVQNEHRKVCHAVRLCCSGHCWHAARGLPACVCSDCS